jgi:hypothetical protein
VQLLGHNRVSFSANFIPANHPHIQYFGRWDMTDPLHPKHSWPGVSVYAEFTGASIGVRMADNDHYYNVYIDGKVHDIFHGSLPDEADYTLADGLPEGRHTFLLVKRNCAQNKIYSIAGFLLDEGAALLPPPPKPALKIEFVGDSFTVAEGNEATVPQMPWQETFAVTNLDKSFAAIIARHFNAQHHVTSRSGIGMVTDWSGDRSLNLPDRFDRALMDASEPKWNFQRWVPSLVVICLGLNDYSGLKDKEGEVSMENSSLYRTRYHDFLTTLRRVYPGVTILAVAAHLEWMRKNVRQVVEEERAQGRQDVSYAQFDYFQNGYVANGHPSVATHEKIAEQLLPAVLQLHFFPPE